MTRKKALFRVWLTMLTTVFCVALFVTQVVAADATQGNVDITVATVNGAPGEDVKVTIDLANNPGLSSLKFSLNYDDVLTLKTVEFGHEFGSYVTAAQPYSNPQVISFVSPIEAVSANGTFATLTFSVRSTITSNYTAPIKLSYESDDVFDADFNNVTANITNGAVNVQAACSHADVVEIPAVEATCTHGGKTAGKKCKTCDAVIEQPQNTDALGHNWDAGVVTKEATPSQDGVRTYTCSRCKETKNETVPKTKADAVFAVSDSKGVPGGKLVVPVQINKNTGIAGFALDVHYDKNILTLDGVKEAPELGGTFTVNGDSVSWYDHANTTITGTVFTLTFSIDSKYGETLHTALPKYVSLSMHNGKPNVVDENSKNIATEFKDGLVAILNYVTGDVTGDNDITIADVVKLNRYVIGLTQLNETELSAGDVTGDSDITIGDVVKLNRYVIGLLDTLDTEPDLTTQDADSPACISVGNVTATIGQSVSIPVSISDNPGIAGMALEFTLPEGATLDSITTGDALSAGTFTQNENVITWYDAKNTTRTGILLNLNITAPQLAGNYQVTAALKENKASNLSDEDGASVAVSFADGTLSVEQIQTDISEFFMSLSKDEYNFDGKEKKPDVTVVDDDKTLKIDKDYTVTYENNVEIGNASVTVSGIGKYTGSKRMTFEIVATKANTIDISNCTAILDKDTYTYDGTEKTPDVDVKYSDKGLTKNIDFNVYYRDNSAVGTATVTIAGKGDYCGTKELHFEIVEAEPKPHTHRYGDPEWLWSDDCKSATATFTCIDKDDTQVVNAKVTVSTIAATTDAEGKSEYTAEIIFDGESYTDTKVITIPKLAKGEHSSTEPIPSPEPAHEKTNNSVVCKDTVFRTYNNKKDLSFSLGVKANGAPLSYKSSNTKKVTVANNGKVTVKKGFMGKVTITVTAAETTKYKKAQKKITVMVGPSTSKLSSVKWDKKKKVVNVSWKKNTTGKGYEVQYSTDKKFKKGVKTVKIKTNTTVKSAIKKLKKGNWHVRIRTINGKTYSDWSKEKSVKVS